MLYALVLFSGPISAGDAELVELLAVELGESVDILGIYSLAVGLLWIISDTLSMTGLALRVSQGFGGIRNILMM